MKGTVTTQVGNPDIIQDKAEDQLVCESGLPSLVEASDPATLPQEFIRSEVNFLVLPFFALSRRDAHQRLQTEYRATVKRGDEKFDVLWAVSANPRYGYPRPFDGKVHKAIEQIVSQLKPPIENPLRIGSLYGIARLLNLKDSGRVYLSIKAAIQRIVTTSVESKGTFYHKGSKRWIEDTFHIYDRAVFVGETLPGGETADTNYLFLSSWYLDNVNERHVKPLDYTYYRSLRSYVASRLYELLGVKFYGMGRYPHIRYRYSNLCQLLPVTQHRYASDAKRKLHPAHQELTSTDFLRKVEWEGIPGENHDWYVHYWPGPRAKEEIRRFSRQVALQTEAPSYESPDPQTPEPPASKPASQPNSAKPKTSGEKQAPKKSESTDEHQELLKELDQLGVSRNMAEDLLSHSDHQTIRNWIVLVRESESVQDRPAYLVTAVREGWQLPEPFQKKQEELEWAEHQEEERGRRDNCPVCQGRGVYQINGSAVALCDHTGRKKRRSSKGRNQELDTQAVWGQTLKALRDQIPAHTYETRLKDTSFLGMDGNTAIVEVSSYCMVEQLERFYQSIAGTLEQVLGQKVEIEFVSAAAPERQ